MLILFSEKTVEMQWDFYWTMEPTLILDIQMETRM